MKNKQPLHGLEIRLLPEPGLMRRRLRQDAFSTPVPVTGKPQFAKKGKTHEKK